jgi:hypothetical protein
MTVEQFTDAVEVLGSQDTIQLKLEGHTSQTQPLQSWQDDASNVHGEFTGDGRLQIGNEAAGATDGALIEVNHEISSATLTPVSGGWHSLGRITGALTSAVTWVMHELRLQGSGSLNGLFVAMRAKLTNSHANTTGITTADLRAMDAQTVNNIGSSGTRVGKATGMRATVSNAVGAYLSKAIGVEAGLDSDNDGDITEAVAIEVIQPPSPGGTIGTLYGLKIPDLTHGSTNYAIHTGQGPVRLGDAVTAESYKLGTPSQLTLSSDAVTVTKGYHTIAAQTGTADNLATLNGGSGNVLVLLQAKAGDTITVKHGTGNIFLNGAADFTLSGGKSLLLFYDGTNWADLGAGGGASGIAAVQKNGASVTTNATTLNFADPAANNENPSAGVAAVYTNVPSICNGRLTLESGIPIPTTDQTAKTSIYFTPYKGAQISLYDGTRWKLYNFTELTLTVPATLFKLFDIYIYDNAGTLTLEAVDWNQSTGSITGATNATPIVITSNSHGLSIGDLVGIASVGGNTAPNGKIWRVSATTTNTFTLEGSIGNGAYTSGGTWYKVPNTRATALTTQDGVCVKTGATTRRYLGTAMSTDVSGQCEDSTSKRYLWNYYNRTLRVCRVVDTTNQWTYNSATPHAVNANAAANRVEVVTGQSEEITTVTSWSIPVPGLSVSGASLVGIDTVATNSAQIVTWVANGASGNILAPAIAVYKGVLAVGYRTIYWTELARGGTCTFLGDNNLSPEQAGLFAEIMG